MTATLRAEASPSAADIIRELEAATSRPDATLRAAVEHASEVAPAIIDVVRKATTGADLPDAEKNLLFWGIHVLGAARRTELFQPLVRLIRECPADQFEYLLGDAQTETLAKVIISVFDGDSASLFEACAHRDIDEYVRWELINAATRLTFDGSIPRHTTMDFLDRFEREPLAEPDDSAWQGWQDAIALLGLEEMRNRLRTACREGRFRQDDGEIAFSEKQLTVARSLAPGDPALFVRAGLAPIDDPVEALESFEEIGDPDLRGEGEDDVQPDPARSVALQPQEIEWLAAVLASERMPNDVMTVEGIDGYLCALAMRADRTQAHGDARAILRNFGGMSAFESKEQGERAARLLERMWTTIIDRLGTHYPHMPILRQSDAPKGQLWAKGFVAGMQTANSLWWYALKEEDVRGFLTPILGLVLDDGVVEEGLEATPERRAEWTQLLPAVLVGLDALLRLRRQDHVASQQPVRSTKVGRNEPCPCGGGKKFKRCCGSPNAPASTDRAAPVSRPTRRGP